MPTHLAFRLTPFVCSFVPFPDYRQWSAIVLIGTFSEHDPVMVLLYSSHYSGLMCLLHIRTKSVDLVLFTYARGLSITLESNKQQETYADMTNRLVGNDKAGYMSHP